MNLRIFLSIAVLAFATAGVISGWLGSRHPAPLDLGALPEVLDVRVELHEGEIVRHVKLYPDGVTPQHAVADNVDGTLTNFWYRPDGTLEKATTESSADETGARKQLRYSTIGKDGLTYIYDVKFNLAGIKIQETRLMDFVTMERSYFFDNGDLRRSQTITMVGDKWTLTSEDILRPDGSVAETLRPLNSYGWERKTFAVSGQAIVTKVLTPWRGRYTEERLWEGTSIVAVSIKQDSEGTEMIRRRPDGTLEEGRYWNGPLDDNSLFVDVYDEQGKRLYRQSWALDAKVPPRLYMVVEYDEDEKMVRSYYFDNASKEVTEHVYLVPGVGQKSIRSVFRPDGTLRVRETPTADGKSERKEFSVKDNVRLVIDTERTRFRTAELPPYVVKFVPERDDR